MSESKGIKVPHRRIRDVEFADRPVISLGVYHAPLIPEEIATTPLLASDGI